MTGSAMNPAFTISAIPGDDLVARQRLQRREVDEHRGGLVERADEVLARIGVDAGLSADGGIHHREQCRRHVHDVDSTQPCGGGESRNVGGRSPAEADDGVLAAQARCGRAPPRCNRRPAVPCQPRHRGSRCDGRRCPCRTDDLRIASAVWASVGWCRIATLCRPSRMHPAPIRPVPMTTG